MPRFHPHPDQTFCDYFICQNCGRDLPSCTGDSKWMKMGKMVREGNVCGSCRAHAAPVSPIERTILDSPRRAPELESLLNAVIPERKERLANAQCATCGADVRLADFRDAISRKEYLISRMCQKCQDSVFGAHEPDMEAEAEIQDIEGGQP